MTRLRMTSLLGLLVALGLGVLAPRIHAQAKTPPATVAPAPAPGASTPPKFSDDDMLLLQAVATVGQLANQDCQGLDSVKRYNAQRNQVVARMEQKYPGYTVDWSAGALVVKPPAAK